MSVGFDRLWRRRTAGLLALQPGDLAADLCGGTGDLALTVQRQYPHARVLLIDFAQEMLQRAPPKLEKTAGRRPRAIAGDACRLPLADGSCAGVAAAFGFRNLRSARAGLEEARRVLKPGGRLAMLEFFRPTGLFSRAKSAGLLAFPPTIAWLVAPRRAPAYRYLARSILRFLSLDEMRALLDEIGFTDVTVHPQILGIATIMGATRR